MIELLIDPHPPEGFDVVTTEAVPGLPVDHQRNRCQIQAFNRVWKGKIPATQTARPFNRCFEMILRVPLVFNVFLQISLNCSPYSLERVFQTAEIHSLRHHKPSIWHRSSGRRRDSNHSVWYVSSCVNWNAYFTLISFFQALPLLHLGKLYITSQVLRWVPPLKVCLALFYLLPGVDVSINAAQ